MKHAFASFLTLNILAAAALAQTSAIEGPKGPAPGALPAPASQDAKMKWFRDAKFGLFIHWGLYSIPAGEWKGQPIAGIGEWIMNRAKIPVTEYEQLATQFNPVKFDAEAWVQMAQDAGMKYIVITSKHHDGFAMYHSAVTKYNIYDATPFHRDPLKELAAACAKHGIKFGFYYSQSQDWHEPNGAGNTWDFGPDDKKDYDQYLRAKAEPQVKELLSNYGPVCLIWFDTARMMTGDRGPRFLDIVHTLQPATLIDGRLGVPGDYRSMGDNSIPNQVVQGDWEVPATLNHTWGFKKDDTDWKSPEDLTFKLVDITSKGGNYLLNVGPTSEGLIPQASQDNLRAVGRWLKVNGESIYGAGPTPFGEELGAIDNTRQDKKGGPLFVATNNWRCTTKPGKIYIHLFQWPSGQFEVSKVNGKVKKAFLLADASHKSLKLTQSGDKLTVALPAQAPDTLDSVLVLEQ
ncbi:MAG TPA: alpha-L-fucosidase [Bryobacteraceae bacterium]|nr:alpha-L-fucosidase [Bryobacteraceae bacterium]